MELTHRFTVPAGMDATWAAFEDVEQLAACFPGATVTGVEGETFTGTCKVRLGPIALVYGGSGTFVSRDREAGTFRVEAKGKDKRGNGTAGATVTASFSDQGESTEVEVRTDLAITGKPAQFGRGVIQDVSDKLLNQFVDCLQEKVGDRIDEAAADDDQDAGPASVPTGAAAAKPTPPGEDPDAGPASVPQGAVGTGATGSGPSSRSARADDDAVDLGAAVLPVLARTYGLRLLAGLVVLYLLKVLLGRRRTKG